jgi:signal transduction histidine kinase/ActR/RegA family two-component response regulator
MAPDQNRLLRQVAELARTVSSTVELETVLQRVAGAVVALRSDAACAVRLVDPARGGYRLSALAGPVSARLDLVPFGQGLSHVVAESRRPLLVADLAGDPRMVGPPERGAYLGVPIEVGTELLGVLSVSFAVGAPPSAEEQEAIELLAGQAAVAIRNARDFARSEARRRGAEGLAAVSRALAETLDPTEIARRVAAGLLAQFGTRHAAVYRLDEGTGALVTVAIASADGRNRGPVVLPRGHGSPWRAIEAGGPVRSSRALEDPRLVYPEPLRSRLARGGLGSVLALPLGIRGEPRGAVSMLDEAGRSFDDEEVRLARAFADQAAVALETARLYEAEQRRAASLRGLVELNRVVSASLDSAEVFPAIARAARELLGVDAVHLWQADEDRRLLHCRGTSYEPGTTPCPVTEMTYGAGMAGAVAARRQPLHMAADHPDWPGLAVAWMRAEGLRDCLSVPIVIDGFLLGVLSFVSRGRLRVGPAEQELVDAFVAQAATAIHNARLHTDLRAALTRLEASQRELARAERLQAMGQLAAGVAHDFNNLLAPILGRAELLAERLDASELRRHAEVIARMAHEAAAKVRRIQSFVRTRPSRPVPRVDLNVIVADAVELTRPRWRDTAQADSLHYDVVTRLAPDLPPVAADPDELREVLVEAIFNALDAMPGGGRIGLRTWVDGEAVRGSVTDTGLGMTEDVRARAFEPFFTTKPGRARGLGLSVIYGSLTRHGGGVDLESAPGRGTTLTLWLPLAAVPPAPPAEPGAAGRLHVLVVDDEPEVRDLLAELVGADGHRVTACASAAEALARLEAAGADLVITDLGMPGMSGLELAEAVRRRWPDLPVGMVTGWGETADRERSAAAGVLAVLGKPFQRPELRALLARAERLSRREAR